MRGNVKIIEIGNENKVVFEPLVSPCNVLAPSLDCNDKL